MTSSTTRRHLSKQKRNKSQQNTTKSLKFEWQSSKETENHTKNFVHCLNINVQDKIGHILDESWVLKLQQKTEDKQLLEMLMQMMMMIYFLLEFAFINLIFLLLTLSDSL